MRVSRQRILLSFASLSLAVAMPSAVHAWGDEGHQVVGTIADHYLNDKARAAVQDLLSGPALPSSPNEFQQLSHSMADRAMFADKYRESGQRKGALPQIRKRYDDTHFWHFVDGTVLDDRSRDAFDSSFSAQCPEPTLSGTAFKGPAKDCVVDKINQFLAELKDPATPREERILALEFLLHFVGDIHQPLHAAEHDNDLGGNGVPFTGGKLHSYWDTNTVKRLGSNADSIAASLIADIGETLPTAWCAGTPRSWAHDSYDLARTIAYNYPATHKATPAYATAATGVARKQLERAGVRLACLLNDALGS